MTTETKPIRGRAYSLFTVEKAAEAGGKRSFSGVATTPTADRMGDIVQPMGVTFKNPLPLLWQHKHDQPIGWVKFGKPTKAGIPFDAEVAMIPEESNLKNRIDDAWLSIKHGLVPAVSIGFSAQKWAWIGDYDGIEFQETEVYELSAVTIPANPDAVISEVSNAKGAAEAAMILKSFDTSAPEAAARPERPTDSSEEAEAATGQKSAPEVDPAKRGHVAKLVTPARVGAPFVINRINHLR